VANDDGAKARWSERRDMFAATREAMIISAVAMVFIAPATVRSTLERAGISSFAGVEFSIEDVVDANEQVAVAESEVAKLAEQLASVDAKLESMTASGIAEPEDIKAIAAAVHSMKSQADQVDDSLRSTTRKMERAIQLMGPEKLRELAERNALRADNYSANQRPIQQEAWLAPPQQMMISEPPVQSALLNDSPSNTRSVDR